jgi:hypothetical protein
VKEDRTRDLVRKVIAHARGFYKAQKGVVHRLGELGYGGKNGDAYSQQAISAWMTKGTGLSANVLLSLAEDMKLDLNALVYQGEISRYNPDADLRRQIRVLQQATTDAQRLLDLAGGPDKSGT